MRKEQIPFGKVAKAMALPLMNADARVSKDAEPKKYSRGRWLAAGLRRFFAF